MESKEEVFKEYVYSWRKHPQTSNLIGRKILRASYGNREEYGNMKRVDKNRKYYNKTLNLMTHYNSANRMRDLIIRFL